MKASAANSPPAQWPIASISWRRPGRGGDHGDNAGSNGIVAPGQLLAALRRRTANAESGLIADEVMSHSTLRRVVRLARQGEAARPTDDARQGLTGAAVPWAR